MPLVAGVDSSTQSCKVLILDADTGAEVRSGVATHPAGTEVDPAHWWAALTEALSAADGLGDVAAVSIGGQQHGMVCLDADGAVIRPALLWNDTRSAQAARDLIVELGDGDESVGRARWAEAIGSVPVASLTVTKLRWLADNEPDNATRIAAICLPHDWLTWRLLGGDLDALVTDRSDASGTGYFDSVTNQYRLDLLALALRRDDVSDIRLPRVLAPDESAGTANGIGLPDLVVGPGCGDNAGAALGLGLSAGQVSLSLGTSGVAAAVSDTPTHDHTGMITGFADASGRYLPLAATLNAARVLDATARVLDVDHEALTELALSADPGSGGLVHVPYLEGERTPNLPDATGSWHGLTLASMTRPNVARSAVEGLSCLMAEALDAVRAQGVTIERVTLVGGAARSGAVQRILPAVLGLEVDVPPPGEYVARGAARQAAWTLAAASGNPTPEPPEWPIGDLNRCSAAPTPEVLAAYRTVRPWSVG